MQRCLESCDPATLSFPPLHNPFTAFASPHHQGCHEEGDQDGHHNEGTQDAIGWVPQKPSRERAVMKVVSVDLNKKLIHHSVGPKAVHH